MDRRSSGLQGRPEVGNSQNVWDYSPISNFKLRTQGHTSREIILDAHTNEQNCDRKEHSFGFSKLNLRGQRYPKYAFGYFLPM